MSRKSLLLPAVLALVMALTGSGSAGAAPQPDRVSVKDRAGDAPAAIDLLSGSYAISKKTVVFRTKVKRLTEATFLAFEVHLYLDAWDRIAVYRENGRTVGKVYFMDNDADTYPDAPHPVPRACPGLRLSWSFARDEVSVTAPRSCLQGTSSYPPFFFHTYSRIGGVSDSPRDAMPVKKINP